MSKTEANLKEAFAGESQAGQRYLAFAGRADKQGYPQVAKLFRAAAEAERIHAFNHLRTLKGIGSTEENLKEAIAGETFEFTTMYPEMLTQAEAEEDKKALKTFNYANETEKIHAQLFEAALASLGEEAAEESYYVCPACGHTAAGEAPEKCPICGTLAKFYLEIN